MSSIRLLCIMNIQCLSSTLCTQSYLIQNLYTTRLTLQSTMLLCHTINHTTSPTILST